MAILANRVKTKNNLLELIRAVTFSLRKIFVIALICICLYWLHSPMTWVSRASLELSGILLSAGSFVSDLVIDNVKSLSDRLTYFRNLEAENLKLKLQLSKLKELENKTADLLLENRDLRQLLRVTEELEHHYVTSRLTSVSVTPLQSSAIVEAGTSSGVKVNDLVISQEGLIGKIVAVSDNYSSVALLNDPGSRVPVITSSSRERGILAKHDDSTETFGSLKNVGEMALIYLPEDHKVEVGESVYTSGDGKIYPYGLLIGTVSQVTNEGVFVTLSNKLNNANFVMIYSH